MNAGPALRRQSAPYAQIPEWVLYHDKLNPTAKTAYGVLHRHAGQDGACFPGRELLATQVNVSVRTIDAAIDQLVAVGAVIVSTRWVSVTNPKDVLVLGQDEGREQRKGRRQTSNDYFVCEWPFGVAPPIPPRSGVQDLHPGGARSAPEVTKEQPTTSVSSNGTETYRDDHARQSRPAPARPNVSRTAEVMTARDERSGRRRTADRRR